MLAQILSSRETATLNILALLTSSPAAAAAATALPEPPADVARNVSLVPRDSGKWGAAVTVDYHGDNASSNNKYITTLNFCTEECYNYNYGGTHGAMLTSWGTAHPPGTAHTTPTLTATHRLPSVCWRAGDQDRQCLCGQDYTVHECAVRGPLDQGCKH
jgi:hypothetical protein